MKHMIKLNKNTNGFTVVEVLLVIFTLAIVGVAGYFVAKHINKQQAPVAAKVTAKTAVTAPVTKSYVTITNSNNGQTVNLKIGQTLIVDLSNISWSRVPANKTESNQNEWSDFNSSDATALGLVGQTVYSSTPGSISGSTDGSSTQSYKALATGTASATARSETYMVCGTGTGACSNAILVDAFSVTVDVN